MKLSQWLGHLAVADDETLRDQNNSGPAPHGECSKIWIRKLESLIVEFDCLGLRVCELCIALIYQ